jgi:hypothetical protein
MPGSHTKAPAWLPACLGKQAASLAVTKYGASATAVASAMSTGSNGKVEPQSLTSGNAQAAAQAVEKGVEGRAWLLILGLETPYSLHD